MNVDVIEILEGGLNRVPGLQVEYLKQNAMRSVVNSLVPVMIGAVYFFGWRSLAIVLLSIISCVIPEWLFVRKGKVSEAVFVTAILYGLILPPTTPFFMVILGALFGITFGKMAFGGFGMNIFNPALVARAFVYITFPVYSTARWVPAAGFGDFPGGLLAWLYTPKLPVGVSAITSATSLSAFRDGAATLPSLWQLFLGNIYGQFDKLGEMTLIGGGSVGETSTFLIALGGLYLVYKNVANRKIVASFFVSFIILQTVFSFIFPERMLSSENISKRSLSF